jgi:Rho GDP-dissociation inhibitor
MKVVVVFFTRKVIVKSLSLVVEDRDDVVIDLTEELATIKTKSFTIKEGVKFRIKINFVVQREIVHGLKYVQKTYRYIIQI